ncbi:CoA-transferase subunit beta [Anaerolineales bacterium]
MYTMAELLTVCIARQVQNNQVWAQGINTPLVMAGLILAKCTHAPTLAFTSAIGQGLSFEWSPLSITFVEDMWLAKSISHVGFTSAAADILPAIQPHEFFRPAQVDAQGNTNNIAFGKDYHHPRLRLPGTGGIPDVSVMYGGSYLYVPKHAKIIFRKQIDFISGLGHHPDRQQGSGPVYLVSDLGQFDWHNGRMRLVTLHPEVPLEEVVRKTEFELEIAPDLGVTVPPTADELRRIREEIDPLSIRDLELLSGSERRLKLRAIIEAESKINRSFPSSNLADSENDPLAN